MVSFVKKPELIIMLGFTLVTLGIIFLIVTTTSYEGGFVFVFPFFFTGNVDSIGLAIIVGFLLLMTVFFFLMFNNFVNFTQPTTISEEMKTYIRYDTFCTFCGAAMSSDARFCPTCGHEQE